MSLLATMITGNRVYEQLFLPHANTNLDNDGHDHTFGPCGSVQLSNREVFPMRRILELRPMNGCHEWVRCSKQGLNMYRGLDQAMLVFMSWDKPTTQPFCAHQLPLADWVHPSFRYRDA